MKVYIVAGEPSGDLLASGLMRALRRRVPDVEFRGVGGESMAAASPDLSSGALQTRPGDFESLFDIAEISVMGVWEVLPKLSLIAKLIRRTVRDIEEFAPDVLVTVDSWGFVSALLAKLRRKQRKGRMTLPPVVHYVAPQVWAWKKGRAKKIAQLVDRLMTLLPDEGRYFEKYGLQCDFVGHPVVERIADAHIDPTGFRAANDIPLNATVVSVLPGSRHSEVKRLLPIMQEAVGKVAAKCGGEASRFFVVVPTVSTVEDEVRRGFENFDIPARVVTGETDRYNAFAVSDVALAKSGTVALELVALGVPYMTAYTFGRFSDAIAKRLIKVPYANLINLLAGKEIIPEFVLENCRPGPIADCAGELLRSPEKADKQIAEAHKVLQMLRLPDILPSERAAQIVAETAGRTNEQ